MSINELELKQERLISSMDLGSSQLDLLHEILEIERVISSNKADGIKYTCSDCGHIEHWTAKDFADKGEPVCPNDDNDMKRE